MDFDKIENLEEEQLNDMYNEVVDFGDDGHLAACCCHSGQTLGYKDDYIRSRVGCRTWCRLFKASTCRGWGISGITYDCTFSC